jgi:hypothetical protein
VGEKAAVIIAEDLGIQGVTAFWTRWRLLRKINESTWTITWTIFSHPASLSCTFTSSCTYVLATARCQNALCHANVTDLLSLTPIITFEHSDHFHGAVLIWKCHSGSTRYMESPYFSFYTQDLIAVST